VELRHISLVEAEVDFPGQMRVSGVDCRHCGIRPGLRDRVRDHFETAIRQADELLHWLLQQTARNWYGRLLVDDPHPAEQVRGRALIEAAATDFRSLEMITYANLAKQFLRP
jgi:hypothetical protein